MKEFTRNNTVFFCAILVTTLFCMSLFAEQEKATSSTLGDSDIHKKLTIAVIPICLKEAGDVRNRISIVGAALVSQTLRQTKAIQVIPQTMIAEHFKNANIDYCDISQSNMKDVVQAMPTHDIFILSGPLRNEGFFRWVVGRRTDFRGKTTSILISDTQELREKGFGEYLYRRMVGACSYENLDFVVQHLNDEIKETFKDYLPVPNPKKDQAFQVIFPENTAIPAFKGISSVLIAIAKGGSQKEYAEASAFLEKAHRLSPSPYLRYWHAVALSKQGKKDEFKKITQELLSSPIEDELREIILRLCDN